MNKYTKIALTGFVGTSGMTVFSELTSIIFKDDFREPKNLEIMAGRIMPLLSKSGKTIAGWGAHYLMGFVFAAVFVELWERKILAHNLKNGLILGLASGVIGTLIWKATFKIHPLPPSHNFTKFYSQRVIAHVAFALFATGTYQLIQSKFANKDSAVD